MPDGSTRPARTERWCLLAIHLAAAALRLRGLETPSLWRDEIAQAVVGAMPLREIFRGVAGHHGAAPLDYVVTHFVEKAGKSEGLLRLPAALWGVLAIWALHRLARRLVGEPRVALAAAALLAVWPLHVRYSQEGRFYALHVLLVLLALERLTALDESPSPRRFVEAAGLLVLAVWTHVYTLLAAAAFLLYAACRPAERARRLKWAGAAFLTAVIAYVPWYLFAGAGPPGSWRPLFPRPSLWPGLLVTGLEETRASVGAVSFALVPVLAAGGLLMGLLARRRWVLLPAFLAGVGGAGVVGLDVAFSYFFHVRQLVFVAPALVLLAAAGLGALSNALARPLGTPSGALLLAFVLAVAVLLRPALAATSTSRREDWRRAARFLRTALAPDAAIAAEPPEAHLEPFVLFYEPGLAGAFVPPSSLDARIEGGPRRFFAFTQLFVGDVSRAHARLSRVDVGFTPEIPLLYLGDAPRETLLAEAARFDGVPARVFAEDVSMRYGPAAAALGSPGGALFRKEKCDLLTRAGRARFEAGDLATAARLLAEAAAYGPYDTEALNNLGLVLARSRRCGEAAEVLRRSAAYHPRSYWAHFLLGDAEGCLGRFGEAAAEYRAALAIDPRPEARSAADEASALARARLP